MYEHDRGSRGLGIRRSEKTGQREEERGSHLSRFLSKFALCTCLILKKETNNNTFKEPF